MSNASVCFDDCRPLKKYIFQEKLGEGSFGCVFRALNNITKEVVAIKVLKNKHSVSIEECLNMSEVKILRRMRHSNIIRLKELIIEDEVIFIVFEYMQGNLSKIISSKTTILESEIRNRCFQILMGLRHMHGRGYFHRDLKPENILVTGDVTKIADLGSAIEDDSGPPYTEYVTTRWYRAPEYLLRAKTYGPAVDMWAVGAIMAEMFLHRPLFPGKTEIDQIEKIVSILGCPGDPYWCADNRIFVLLINVRYFGQPKCHLSELMPLASEKAIDLMHELLSWDPNKRPTAEQALLHPFFRPCSELQVHSMLRPPGSGYPTKLQLAD